MARWATRLYAALLRRATRGGLDAAALAEAAEGFAERRQHAWRRSVAAWAGLWLRELRSLAHVIDMHQMTKDPESVLGKGPATASSPKRAMTAFELNRYLDYCSEMLSIISKIAALFGQRSDDGVALASVDQIESLTNGLSRKVWQKIMILQNEASSA